MHWRIKAKIFRILDTIPFGNILHYGMQKYLIRSVPRSDEELDKYLIRANHFFDSYKKYSKTSPAESTFFEFGAGRDLVLAISLSSLGVKKTYCYDLNPIAKINLINNVLKFLTKKKGEDYSAINSWKELEALHGIHYRAPGDARNSNLPDDSIDCAISWNTMEHIPKHDIKDILSELWRILKKDGLIIMNIDFTDHYARVDSSINKFNFLQFTDEEWDKVDNSFEHTNRLRLCDYSTLFKEAGFKIIIEDPSSPIFYDGFSSKIDNKFSNHTQKCIYTPTCFFIAKKISIES